MYEKLFESVKIGSITAPNRLAMTAMGNHIANADGTASEADIAFYGARAKGGVGIVITECICVDLATGRGNMAQMGADSDIHIEGLKKLADEVHKHGSVIVGQIYHPGRQGIAVINGGGTMKAPSAVECQAVHQPTHEMTKDEIKEMVKRFSESAKRLKAAGFDAVEVHGAHGYLIGQFLSPYTNKRTDEYGGPLENRIRFLYEILDEIKGACGDFTVFVRLSVDEHLEFAGHPGEGITLKEGVEIAKLLEKKGVDCLDISCGIYESMNTAWEPIGFDEGWKIEGPAAVKAAVSIPVIGVSVIRTPEYAEKVIKEGKADIIGSARLFYADPDWGVKVKEGRIDETRKCISCLYCMETLMEADITGVSVSCAINYEAGREHQYSEALMKKDGAGRTVAIIGGGPAGIEAATVLAKRGFSPVVFEKSDKIGGQVVYASKPPKKEKMHWFIDYQNAQIKKLGIKVNLNAAPSVEDIKKLNPYAVFIAKGSSPIMPSSIEGIKGDNVYTSHQVLAGEADIKGKKVCVIGSGMTGLETAELLAANQNTVSIFEMADDIGPGMFFQNLIDVMGRIGEFGVALYPKHKLVKIENDEGVFVTTDTNSEKRFKFDAFVVSLGVAPNTEDVDAIKGSFDKVIVVGDAEKSGRVSDAVATAYKTAFEL